MAVSDSPKRWAILIGVNFYSRGSGKDFAYPNLRGCVPDVFALEESLIRVFSVEKNCITKLTATAPDDVDGNEPVEDPEYRPTYENIVKAFNSVTNHARKGDLVYIHYSGYGARVATAKAGSVESDDVLVPTDINTGGRYLHVTDLASLLSAMVDKDLLVTIVLDSCHSGSGSPRHSGPVARGIGTVNSPVSFSDKLSEVKEQNSLPLNRKDSSWLPKVDGYEVITACQPHEVANENRYPNEDGEWHGALSFGLLETLKNGSFPTTHEMLFRRIQDHARNDFHCQQTPAFAGDHRRYFFDAPIAVKQVEGDYIFLNGGIANHWCNGTEYWIYPEDTLDFNRCNLLARAIVTEASAVELKARFIKDRCLMWSDVKPGCRAMPFVRPYPQLTLIHVPYNPEYQHHQSKAVDRLYAVHADITFSGIAPLWLVRSANDVTEKDNSDVYTVIINGDANYELWTRNKTGMKLISNFVPCSIPEIFLDRVLHLAQYRIIKNLVKTSLSGNVSFRVKDHPVVESKPMSVDAKDGDIITIVFENNSHASVNLAIFDLQPLWGITQIYPETMDCENVNSGDKRELQLEVSRPPGISSFPAVDTLKSCVTVDRISFRPFEMEDIDIHPDRESATARGRSYDLQSLLDYITMTDSNVQGSGSSAGVLAIMDISVNISSVLDKPSENHLAENDGGEKEVSDQEEIDTRMIINHLSTVIAKERRDFEILPLPNHTVLQKVEEAAGSFVNFLAPQFLARYIPSRSLPQLGNVRWRCRCGKTFAGEIPLDLAERYQSYKLRSHTTESSLKTPGPESQPLDTTNSSKQYLPQTWSFGSEISSCYVYLCIDTRSFPGVQTIAASVVLPLSSKGLCDYDLFRHLRKMYSQIRGTRHVRNVSLFKFVKFQRSHLMHVSCDTREGLPPMNEGYTYEAETTPPLREDEMLHFFHSPECIRGSTSCLRRIPKRTSELERHQIHGWGLYAQESYATVSISVLFIFSLTVVMAYLVFYLGAPI